MNDLIVVINAGSATVKFAEYSVSGNGSAVRNIRRGIAEFVAGGARFHVVDAGSAVIADEPIARDSAQATDIQALLDHALQWLKTHTAGTISAFGHRVVHGADAYSEPVLLNDTVLTQLEKYIPLAPLHQPFNLAAIRATQRLWPAIPQVGCFDTAFHQTQPRVARMFGLPGEYYDQGIKRYGFHGLSYEYIAGALPQYLAERADGKIIVAHLGSGASLCAMRDRKSLATTMGFTALDGLMMGTRCGTIDPGVILYLMNEKHLDGLQIFDLLYRRSGLLGVSGMSADMRELLASLSPRAVQAIDLFVYQVVRQLGALIATLGGLDALIFTGGIGTHSAAIRRRICEAMEWAGISLNVSANASHELRISLEASPVSVWAIPTDEEQVIVGHTVKLAANRRCERA